VIRDPNPRPGDVVNITFEEQQFSVRLVEHLSVGGWVAQRPGWLGQFVVEDEQINRRDMI